MLEQLLVLILITHSLASIVFAIANTMIWRNAQLRLEKQKPISKVIIGSTIATGVVLAIIPLITIISMLGFKIYTIPFMLSLISLWIWILFESTPRPCKPFRVSISITLIAWAIAGIIYLVKLII